MKLQRAKTACAKQLKLNTHVSAITGDRSVRVSMRDLKKLEKCLERKLKGGR